MVLHKEKAFVSIVIFKEATLDLCCFCSGKGSTLGSLASSQSVSFRQGTNVEFGANAFNGGGGAPEPLDVSYSLDPVSNKSRDFHNPMYDAVQNNPDAVGNGSSGNINSMHIRVFCSE